jgi:hypothetical protein
MLMAHWTATKQDWLPKATHSALALIFIKPLHLQFTTQSFISSPFLFWSLTTIITFHQCLLLPLSPPPLLELLALLPRSSQGVIWQTCRSTPSLPFPPQPLPSPLSCRTRLAPPISPNFTSTRFSQGLPLPSPPQHSPWILWPMGQNPPLLPPIISPLGKNW